MGTVREVIESHHSEIIRRWTLAAQQKTSAQDLTSRELASLMPAYLSSLGKSALGEPAQLSETQQGLIEHHLSNRLREGFNLNEILTEFASLGRCVFSVMDGESAARERPSVPDVARLFAELYLTSTAVTQIFNEQLLEDEQTMKRYTRLLRNIAGESEGQPHALPLRKRLDEVLALIMEAMAAQTAALLLFNAKTHSLVMSASTGDADEHLAKYVSSLDIATFAGKIASAEDGAVAATDAETTELEVTETLRQSGIHSLLGIRLSNHHTLRGVLYIGIREQRGFSASEARRLESLGEALTVHLDNAQLRAALREKIDELKAEGELRERFVSILMHDLKGALTTAKINGQLLLAPGANGDSQDLAAKMVHSIDRMDRMVGDLLDTHRIRAGERLPLSVADCDLSTVARGVVEELRALHGDRFVLRADKVVRGMWSADQLHRAAWNLASNAIKYGAEETPVFVSVKRGLETAELAVHNAGPSIPAADQARLFKPFSRAQSAIGGPRRGWGLGLTLVWGCAEAHGGQVAVESEPGKGTTFTLSIPYDARPYTD